MNGDKLIKIGMLSVFLIAAVCSSALGMTFSDNFNSASLDTFWWTADADTGTTIAQTGGRIVMTQSAPTANSLEANLVFNFGIIGDYTAQVDYSLVKWGSDNYERMGIRTPGIAVERISDARFVSGAEGYLTDSLSVLKSTPTTDTSGKLQVQRTGNTVAGSFWNGAGWTEIGSYTFGSTANGDSLWLSIWPFDLKSSIEVAFDNFYLNAPGWQGPTLPRPRPQSCPRTRYHDSPGRRFNWFGRLWEEEIELSPARLFSRKGRAEWSGPFFSSGIGRQLNSMGSPPPRKPMVMGRIISGSSPSPSNRPK